MVELIDKWEVVSKLITLQNNYNFFKNEWDAERLYREIAKLEIEIGKTSGIELVRCKDCKHGIWDEEEQMWECVLTVDLTGDLDTYRMFHEYNDGEHFCSYGERKDNVQ